MIYFASGSANMSSFFSERLAREVSIEPGRCGIDSTLANRSWVIVEGHADKQGAAAANERLSLRRAQNVAHRLIELGVAREYICLNPKGSRAPIVADTQGAEPQHRYVVIYRVNRDWNSDACPTGTVPLDAG
jgi:flagellar motor protein MotB